MFLSYIINKKVHLGLEWGINFVGTSSNPYMSFCSCLIKKKRWMYWIEIL